MHSTLSYSTLASCSGLENYTFRRLWIVSIKLQPIKQYLFGYFYLFKTIGRLRWNEKYYNECIFKTLIDSIIDYT